MYGLTPLCDLELDVTELFLVLVIEMSPLRSVLDRVLWVKGVNGVRAVQREEREGGIGAA